MSSEPPEPKSKMRIAYSREFLLSVGELEICKKLPAGFDASILSDLLEVSAGVLERSRGNFSAPLGRSDGSAGYSYSSRGGSSAGRWDARPSGSSDWDGDLPDHETQDRRSGNQYRRSWQNTEHDGLLGSGAFPRPSGYVGHLASKERGSGYQLNKSSERYQPPRPYKAAPFSRKDIDSINDETFGSFECSNEDRAEEERKRRASFELMRKEQHKALQEKKNTPDNEKENLGDDIISLFQNSAEKSDAITKSEKPDGSAESSVAKEDTTKTSSVLPAPTTRPLVPPGFSNAVVEKKLQLQSCNSSVESEACNSTVGENISTVACFGGAVESSQSASTISASIRKEKGVYDNVASLDQQHALSSSGVITSVEYSSGIPKVSKDWEDRATDKYSTEKGGNSNINSDKQDNSISILEKFFVNALSKSSDSLPTYGERQQLKTDENVMVSSAPESSKFAHWFLDEDSRPAEDSSSKGLLSMIVGDENLSPENMVPGPPVSDGTFESLSPRSPINSCDIASKLLSVTSPASATGILEQCGGVDIPDPLPVMMTCEDLEQTILAQVASTGSSSQQIPVQAHQAVLDEPRAMQKVAVDDHASQHLLSLLQKGTSCKGSSLGFHIGSADEPQSSDVNSVVNGNISGIAVNEAETVPSSGKSLTLETLFGAAFMTELHSKEAPVSVRVSAAGGPNYESDISSSLTIPIAETGKTLFTSNHQEYLPDEQILPLSHIKDGAAPNESGNGMEFRNSAPPGSIRGYVGFDEKSLDIQLPEEDNLFTVNDSLDAQKPVVRSGRVEGLAPEKAVDDLNYRLQSLVPCDAEHIQVLGPDALGSCSHEQHYQVESQILYNLLHGSLPTQAPHPMMDHHIAKQEPFNMPQVIHHDPQTSFPPNMNDVQQALHAPGVPHFDPSARHLMLPNISMPGSFPQGLPRGVPPSQPMHHMPGYRPEMSNVNSFHMHPRQPGHGEFGLPMPVPSGREMGGNHPESFERLIQMELRARSKQIHPAMAGPVPSGIYGPELNMNFRYR